MMRTLLFLVSLSITLSGCVKTRAELRGEEGNGEVLRQTNTQRRENAKPPPPAPKIDEVDEQLRAMNGRIDTVENQLTQINAAHGVEKDSVTKMAQAIDQKFQNYEQAVKQLELEVAALTEEVRKKSVPASSGAPAKGRSAYDDGEDSFTAKKWKEAIVDYQKYRDANPKGKMYADATYKIGFCFQELKLKDEAKAFFDEVVAKFPGSKEAKKAAFRSKQLK